MQMRPARLLCAVLAALGVGRSGALADSGLAELRPEELAPASAARAKAPVPGSVHVADLDRAAYLEMLRTREDVLIEFYANWCAACHGFSPVFSAFAEAAHSKHPRVAVARADITKVEYLSSSYMVSMLPELVFLHRPAPGATHEVRYVSANFTTDALLDYIGGGWAADKPVGGYATLWCTPTNLCGHVGGLLSELVVVVDARLNPFNIPPWSFMAIVATVVYLLGQVGVMYLARLLRRSVRKAMRERDARDAAEPAALAPPTAAAAAARAGASKRAAGKRTKTA